MSDTKRISRRTALKTGMTVLAGSLAATAATSALADDIDAGKMSKSVVAYQFHPAKNGNHCAIPTIGGFGEFLRQTIERKCSPSRQPMYCLRTPQYRTS